MASPRGCAAKWKASRFVVQDTLAMSMPPDAILAARRHKNVTET
jgi:hypothetical protein